MNGMKLKAARGERSQQEVAKELGICTSALSMFENDVRTPNDEIKVKMAKLYHTTVGALFFDE